MKVLIRSNEMVFIHLMGQLIIYFKKHLDCVDFKCRNKMKPTSMFISS